MHDFAIILGMSKSNWFKTERDGKEVVTGAGFAVVLVSLFLGMPTLAVLLMVFVFKSLTIVQVQRDLANSGMSILAGISLFAIGIAVHYFRVRRKRDEDLNPPTV